MEEPIEVVRAKGVLAAADAATACDKLQVEAARLAGMVQAAVAVGLPLDLRPVIDDTAAWAATLETAAATLRTTRMTKQ